jgi:hypothetical protein
MKKLPLLLICVSFLSVSILLANDQGEYPLAVPLFNPAGIEWLPLVNDGRFVLNISCPDGNVIQRTFDAGYVPAFDLSEIKGTLALDGAYTYELVAVANYPSRVRDENNPFDPKALPFVPEVQTGHFRVVDGIIITSTEITELSAEKDVLHLDDVIIDGSLCIGFDCINGENFGFDTLRLKENNLRIHFQDTSNSASFPTRDWRIVVNDSNNGGADYFAVEDSDAGRQVFKIEGGAPASSLYVEDYGRIGLGTSTPVEDLHIAVGDTPTIRLDQDGSGGWAPQIWDLAGNEANFFIRDVTNGSKLPFRIQPNTPGDTLTLRADGTVGMGTWSPQHSLHIVTTGEKASVVMERTDGATTFFSSKTNNANFGSLTNHPIRLLVNGAWKMQLFSDNSLEMRNGALCTTAGQWQDASSREYKENIHGLSAQEAAAALDGLEPVKFNYKVDADEESLGFIAEDVPALVATKSRKTLSAMDVVAVLTKVVQEQQKTIADLQKKVSELEKKTDSK